ncbi:hypothetical protein H9660_10485 [Clostridium sp. Sa3CUN1]|uniref:Uncharacterized protein n=1 Tax=Clostridium gallinarum TaxID=2762246 RepID=A0ABR8Q570_9CLOT|nr:hypothetical protein [Clostridium gallinarum]MBD7915571.1 hypothetical protein [Clostridium gallinarum]
MEKLNKFINYIEGTFNNDKQIEKEKSLNEEIKVPRAKHIIGICNSKIENLPEDFKGYFTIDETYYNHGEKETALRHLFLYTLNEENNVVLTSYELPSNIEYNDFVNSNDKLVMDYNDLKLSEKFTPITFEEREEYFLAESETIFAPEVIFTAVEKVYDGKMYVTEIFRKNGVIVSGSEEPIIYNKIK